MIYAAFLRGINVGGKHKVEMRTLKKIFEDAGMEDVATYINSGNVIFRHSKQASSALIKKLENAIEKECGFFVDVILRDLKNLQAIAKKLPDSDATRCNVMFLWAAIDTPKILEQLPTKPDFDSVQYMPGAVLWSFEKKNAKRSGIAKLIGTQLYKQIYKQMTVRNDNSLRKLVALMEKLDEK